MPHLNLTQFNGLTLTDEPADRILDIIRTKSLSGVSYVVTPNADHFSRLDDSKDVDFVDAYSNADLRLCDSRIIQKLSFIEKTPIRNVICGSDLTLKIMLSDWISRRKILVIGPTPMDTEIVRQKFSLNNLSCHTPPMGFIQNADEIQKCIAAIINSDSDLVFLAVGSPQQEILANKIKQASKAGMAIEATVLCVGASFDFLSGKSTRAPMQIQALHLEWLHRALSNPKRLVPRYTNNFIWILSYLLKRMLRGKSE